MFNLLGIESASSERRPALAIIISRGYEWGVAVLEGDEAEFNLLGRAGDAVAVAEDGRQFDEQAVANAIITGGLPDGVGGELRS